MLGEESRVFVDEGLEAVAVLARGREVLVGKHEEAVHILE